MKEVDPSSDVLFHDGVAFIHIHTTIREIKMKELIKTKDFFPFSYESATLLASQKTSMPFSLP